MNLLTIEFWGSFIMEVIQGKLHRFNFVLRWTLPMMRKLLVVGCWLLGGRVLVGCWLLLVAVGCCLVAACSLLVHCLLLLVVACCCLLLLVATCCHLLSLGVACCRSSVVGCSKQVVLCSEFWYNTNPGSLVTGRTEVAFFAENYVIFIVQSYPGYFFTVSLSDYLAARNPNRSISLILNLSGLLSSYRYL